MFLFQKIAQRLVIKAELAEDIEYLAAQSFTLFLQFAEESVENNTFPRFSRPTAGSIRAT